MAYTLTRGRKVDVVRTRGQVTCADRMAIVNQLNDLGRTKTCRAAVIDHRDAQILTSAVEAAAFSDLIVGLQTRLQYMFIYVIASEANRAIIDVSVGSAQCKGICIAVCESAEEAWEELGNFFHEATDLV